MKKIVVTGAAGYIGSVLVSKLLKDGHEVTCFDNIFFNQLDLVQSVFDHPNCKLYIEDVTKWSDVLVRAIEEADVVVPLAALVGAPLCDKFPNTTKSVNQEWFSELLQYLDRQLVIYPNTNSGYGSTGDAICTEETPSNPLSLYAQTKQAAEDILLTNYKNTIVFRLATVFGVSYRMRLDLLVNNLTMRAMLDNHLELFDGHFRRNYVHVEDVVEAFVFAIYNPDKLVGNVFNLGNDSINMTKESLVKTICKHTGATYETIRHRTDPDKRDYLVSSEKLKNAGFVASRDLESQLPYLCDHISLLKGLGAFEDKSIVLRMKNY